MCFYNGIKISRADHIRLKDIEITLKDYDLSLLKPLQSGFDFDDWPVIRPTKDGAELLLMHWELIPHYLRTWADVERFRYGGLNPKTGKKDPPKINDLKKTVLFFGVFLFRIGFFPLKRHNATAFGMKTIIPK